MMGSVRLSALVLGLVVAAASGCPPPVPNPQPEPVPDGGPVGCAEVCDRWRVLGCAEADPTPAGAPCEEVCLTASQSEFLYWNLPCRANVSACEDIDECER